MDIKNKEELEIYIEVNRSKVRRYITFGAAIVLAFIFIWGTTWMGDRSIATAAISFGTALIGYWFGERSGKKAEKTSKEE